MRHVATEENQDQSMEEILQSIKRIIADEDDDLSAGEQASQPASDVLELTELVQEDGTISNITERTVGFEDLSLGDDALISRSAADASAAALKSLSQSAKLPPKPTARVDAPAFRSGETVEDLVLEALKPMIKDWLDSNLPEIVERLVQKEIRRLSD